MPALWTWELADSAGNTLAELTTAAGKQLDGARNRHWEGQFAFSHDDDAAELLLGAVAATGMPQLRCYRRAPGDSEGTLRFNGTLWAVQEAAEETSILTAYFRSPYGVLYGDGNERGRYVNPAVNYAATDAGLILKGLVDTANTDSPTGLRTNSGNIEATKTRDRSYPLGTNVGQAGIDLTEVLDGFDFYEVFVDGEGTTLADLMVVAEQGDVMDEARFEYGPGTVRNCSAVTRNIAPPANCILVLGGNGLTATYTDAASVAVYGKWYAKADFSDVTEQTTLDDKARALVRPRPIETVTFTPEYGLDECPKPFDDFGIGDTVPVYANRGALQIDAQVRLNGMTILIDEDGLETASIQDPISPDEDAVRRASLKVEVVA